MNCNQAQPYYYGFLNEQESIPADAAEHLRSCTHCQAQMERLSNELQSQCAVAGNKVLLHKTLKLHASLLDKWVSCETVKPFLPMTQVNGLRVTAATPVTVHIDKCAQCRAHLECIGSLQLTSEQLMMAAGFFAGANPLTGLDAAVQNTLQTIADCADSGIETRMSSMDADSAVDIDRCRPAVQVRYARQSTSRSRSRSLGYLLTGGVAVAAVLLVVMLLPTAASGNLQKVSRAVNSVSNVHIMRYSQQKELIQELWISRNLGFKLYKRPQDTLFKDLHSGRIMQARPDGEPSYLDDSIREQDKYANLLPFEQLKDLPAQYEWTFKGHTSLDDGREVKVYELSWDTVISSVTIHRKWRGYLDLDSNLPYKIEWFEAVGQEPFELFTTLLVDYPTQAQCRRQLETEGFQRFLTPSQFE